ncbi:hypothetical protein [Sphingobium sp. HDIP04]|uniref:hypothetical protein n=1 Tax=Sphingobium sp. HDIP04 TaxID=428994 RepID=UPI0003877AC3|nr:hypothetical protein [Sphingobium sp. HDIP04]EQA97290.1 hypothetical protein L286_23485 [Sphingobium sp. HDIP04]
MNKTVREAEQDRVAEILRRDREDAERERRRAVAEKQVESGEFANLDDTVVPPTPELLKTGAFVPYTPKGNNGTVRSVRTVRRLLISQIAYLYSHGVLDDDLFAACRWYKDRWDAAEMEPSAPVSSYGESIRGDLVYGHLPRSQWAAEARSDFRFANSFIPIEVVHVFDAIVLHDQTLRDVSKMIRRGDRYIKAALLAGALALHGGIAHRLEIERRFS